jgi:DNA repair exonuclease SbcCD ATPase subunit
MIVLKGMWWENAFSYGKGLNYIAFDKNQITQLLGKNGHGKSSIALLLEEILFNTNSKNVKKSDILNRYTNAKSYNISLDFSKDGDDYSITTNRGSTQTVKLYKNKEDISAHTSTATYKLIKDIIGLDSKTFSQIVYQSSANSLEFLTATDTNRKKFLIDLLDLSNYSKYGEVFKSILKEVNTELDTVTTKLNTINTWLNKLEDQDLVKRELQEVPEPLRDNMSLISEYSSQLNNIEFNNKRIIQNNKYKEILYSFVLHPVDRPTSNLLDIKVKLAGIQNELIKVNSAVKGTIATKCDKCGQPIDASHKIALQEEAKKEADRLLPIYSGLRIEQEEATKAWDSYNASVAAQQEYEKYYALIDKNLQTELFSKTDIERNIKELKTELDIRNNLISKITKSNTEVIAHNTKVDVVLGQMDSMKADRVKYQAEYDRLSKRVANLQVLVKTFSTSGLVSYKIECLVKDLESLTNEYLANMSDGRFQLYFTVNSSDKLNVVIVDNGRDVDIQSLSMGERSRVNVSTLLAIRKLMQSLSNSRINLLILDETIESLDPEGKERLIEVLSEEEYLNTIIVSHGYTHPLLSKVTVVKENNMSRIE